MSMLEFLQARTRFVLVDIFVANFEPHYTQYAIA